jgi:hypothetical protein
MNSHAKPVATLVWTFALIPLFAIGGANSASPEMHRIAVDVRHWMNDRQFADIFAICQLSPGPNVPILTLIAYHIAGVAGALAATVAMCDPTGSGVAVRLADYGLGGGPGLRHAAQSAVDVAGRRGFWFCWRCLRKIARQCWGGVTVPVG